MRRRAVTGVARTKPIFYRGRQVGEERWVEYSDSLLVTLWRAARRYAERYTIMHDIEGRAREVAAEMGLTDPGDVDEIVAFARRLVAPADDL
jgi:hypothetical protein